MRRKLLFEKLLKLLQLFLVNVGNSPIVKLRIKPMDKVITLARDRIHYLLCSRPVEQRLVTANLIEL